MVPNDSKSDLPLAQSKHDAILQVNLAKMFPCVNSNPLKDSSNCSCTNFFPGSGENHQRCQSVNPTQKTKAANSIIIVTGKSLSEALLFAEHGENMLCTKIVLNVRNNLCTQHVLPRFELEILMY